MVTNTQIAYMPETLRECICGAPGESDTGAVLARDDLGGEVFRFVRCEVCGTYRVTPRPALGDIHKFYPMGYRNHSAEATLSDRRALELKLRVYRAWWAPTAERTRGGWRDRLFKLLSWPVRHRTPLAFVPPPVRSVFDVGAAVGADLMVFKAAGWNVAGCEPSENAARIAQAQGLDVRHSSGEDLQLAPESVGCVHLNNVFEHVHHPDRILAQAYTALVPDGKLIIVVPNHQSLGARWFGAAWPGFDAPRHLWGFTETGLRSALARHGFAVESTVHLPAGAWSWMDCWTGVRQPDYRQASSSRVARAVAMALLPIGVLATWIGYGDALRVVAVKRHSESP